MAYVFVLHTDGSRAADFDVDSHDFSLYQKTKPAEALQMSVPFSVETLEGVMTGKVGDYLMRGPAGELYPCDQTIFNDTYALQVALDA